jgi:Sulfotransferase family
MVFFCYRTRVLYLYLFIVLYDYFTLAERHSISSHVRRAGENTNETRKKDKGLKYLQLKDEPDTNDSLLVEYWDSIYLRGDWDAAPVIIEKYKLVFFTVAKVGCTVWKQLFRRIEGYEDWRTETYDSMIPWNPELNGLKYLYDYDREGASKILTDPKWTKAIFVRDPKVRFVSAYFDKVINNPAYFSEKCCAYTKKCVLPAQKSISNFLNVIHYCEDAHWTPLSRRILEAKYWQYIDFVGHMETIYEDAETLLRRVGAWDSYGSSGWGEDGNEAIFSSQSGVKHATNATDKLKMVLTSELEQEIDSFYSKDYENPVLNLTKLKVYSDHLRY